MAALGNLNRGVLVEGGPTGNLIGGTQANAGNLISGNEAAGIGLFGVGTEGNQIQGNLIGTDITGMSPMGNGISYGLPGIRVAEGAANNLIGGTEPGAGNTIAFNGSAGMAINADAGSGNSILSNSVFSNEGLGIDLGDDGVTLNDPLDNDAGPNDLQNYPIITAVIPRGKSVMIYGFLASAPGTRYRLEFFSNDECDPSGYGEGQAYLGSASVRTNRSGIWSFIITLPVSLPQGASVTATATDPAGSTSEFSQCVSPTMQWIAAFTYDLPPGSWADGVHPYHFEFEWTSPKTGSFSGQEGELFVSNEAQLYDGYVLLRGPEELRRVVNPGGPVCEAVEAVHPDQPTRFLIGWLPGGEMTYPEALAHFESITARVVWDDGTAADLIQHEIRPFSFEDLDKWIDYVCTYTVRD
jgi:hypothetical protein